MAPELEEKSIGELEDEIVFRDLESGTLEFEFGYLGPGFIYSNGSVVGKGA